jgi:hypothetical protein
MSDKLLVTLLLLVVFNSATIAAAYKCNANNSHEWKGDSLEKQSHLVWREFMIDRDSGKTYTDTPGTFK